MPHLHTARWSFQLTALNTLHILNDGMEASLLLILPFIATDVGLSLTQVGLLGALLNVSAIVVALQTGAITRRIGGLYALVVALGVYSLGFLGTAFAHDVTWLVATFTLAGIGFGVFHPIAFSLVAHWSTKQTRGGAMGRFTAIGEIGKVVLPGVLTVVVVQAGWRTPALAYALGALVVAVGLLVSVHGRRSAESAPSAAAGSVNWRAACNVPFMYAAATTFFDAIASASLFIFLPFLLLQRGIDPAILGSLVALFFMGSFAGKIYIGKLIDKLGAAKVFIMTDVLMAICITLLVMTTWFPAVIALVAVLGVLTKGTLPILQTMVSQSAEGHGNFEKAFGLNSFISGFAITLAPLALGVVSDIWGIIAAFQCMAVAAVMAIVPAFGFHRVGKRQG